MPRRAAGEGTIAKRKLTRADGTVYYRWFARITTGWDGKKKTMQDGPWREKQAAAKQDLAELKRKFAKGLLSAGSNQRLNDYVDAWLERVAQNNKYRTYQTYESDMRNHVLPHLGNMKLSQIRKVNVQSMVDAVHAAATEDGKDGRATARKARAALRTALQEAVDLDILEYNPCARVKVPPEQVDETELWTPEEAAKFLLAAQHHRIYPIIYTAITTGMREGELLGLRWNDFETYLDPESKEPIRELVGQLYIRKAIVYVPQKDHELAKRKPSMEHVHGNLFLDDPKTEKSKSYVTIPADTVEELLIHRFRQQQEAVRFHSWQDFGLIFPAKFGTPMSPKSLQDAYKLILKKAGVPIIKFHDLRDTHATYLLLQGEDLGTVSDRLRHSTKSTTLNRYVQVLSKRRRKAAKKLKEMLRD